MRAFTALILSIWPGNLVQWTFGLLLLQKSKLKPREPGIDRGRAAD